MIHWEDKKVPPVKNLLKNPLSYFVAVFVLGGAAAIASVSNCGTPCTFIAAKATEMIADMNKARIEQGAPVSTTAVQ